MPNPHILAMFCSAGPNHIKVYVMPKPGVELVRWSVGSDPEPTPCSLPQSQDVNYFIYYSYGVKPDHPWQFWIDLRVREMYSLLIVHVMSPPSPVRGSQKYGDESENIC